MTALCLSPAAPVAAASFVTGSYSYDYEFLLGDGTTCNQSPATRPCSAVGSGGGPFLPNQLIVAPSHSVSNRIGGGGSGVSFRALQARDPFRSFGGFEIKQGFRMSLTEASASQTALAVEASFHGRIVMDMTTALLPGQTTQLTIDFDDENTFDLWDVPGDLVASSEFRLNDLTTGSTLASLSLASGGGDLNLDSASLIGHQIELLFDASFLATLPSGYTEHIINNTFDVDVTTTFTIVDPPIPPIPEPATGAMLALGLCAIAIARRSRAH